MYANNDIANQFCSATKWHRFGNYLLDIVILNVLVFIAGFAAGAVLALGLGGPAFQKLVDSPVTDWTISASIVFLYYFIFEAAWQRTPGKFITGTKVVSSDGRKLTATTIAIRTFIRFFPFEPVSFFGKESGGWHDKWSYTAVVKAKRVEREIGSTSAAISGGEKAVAVTGFSETEQDKEANAKTQEVVTSK